MVRRGHLCPGLGEYCGLCERGQVIGRVKEQSFESFILTIILGIEAQGHQLIWGEIGARRGSIR